jgi:hypothetical protein
MVQLLLELNLSLLFLFDMSILDSIDKLIEFFILSLLCLAKFAEPGLF